MRHFEHLKVKWSKPFSSLMRKRVLEKLRIYQNSTIIKTLRTYNNTRKGPHSCIGQLKIPLAPIPPPWLMIILSAQTCLFDTTISPHRQKNEKENIVYMCCGNTFPVSNS